MSALKHEIRQKQAQFNTLETLLLRGPRPLPPSPPPNELNLPSTSTSTSTKMPRRSSWEQLSGLIASGPGSHIPLPLPTHVNGRSSSSNIKQDDVIREGVPLEFSVSSLSSSASTTRRAESPTRSMSRTYYLSISSVTRHK